MSTNDYDYDDDVRQKAALGLLRLSPTNLHSPSTPLSFSGTSLSPGPLSGAVPGLLGHNFSPSRSGSAAPRRRTPTMSSNNSVAGAVSTLQAAVGLGKALEGESYVGQPTSPVIPLKRKHPSNTNEAHQLPQASSQVQGRRRGAGSGNSRGTSGRGRGGRAASSSAGGAGIRHAASEGPQSAGPSTSTRFDPVAHAGGRRSIDPDAVSREIDSFSTHAATPDRDQDMSITSTNAQNDPDADPNADSDVDPESAEAIRCICGFANDDGWSIGCDGCGRWCHGVCFGIDEKDKENLPERWECWVCNPTLEVDREKAVRSQKARLGLGKSSGDGEGDADKVNSRRRASPGVERKQRKSSAGTGTIENGHKRRRRSSIITSPVDRLSALPSNHQVDHPAHSHSNKGATPPSGPPNGTSPANTALGEDTIVDIDEPWNLAYNDIAHDIVPQKETRDKLRRQAAQWRGVTAISPVVDSQIPDTPTQPDYSQQQPYLATGQQYPPASSPVTVRPLNQILDPGQPTPTNLPPHLLRPPTYALLTTSPVPSSSLITPFPSIITSSATYLADPLNAYAHLGLPKPYVHLIGPPLDVALDARIAGGKGRWARSGCRPNAVLRPVVCDGVSSDKKNPKNAKEDKRHAKGSNGEGDSGTDNEADSQTLAFGIFALRDLKANEEVVLGWEWDDGNVVHQLPALLNEEGFFPPTDLHFRLQMSNILHTLSSTFTACACGAHVRDCAIRRMAEFVERGERLEQEEEAKQVKEPVDVERRRRAEKDALHPPSPWTPGPGLPVTPFSAASTPRLPWDAFSVPPRPSSVPQTTSMPTSTPTTSTSSFTLPHERRLNASPDSDKEIPSSSIPRREQASSVDLGPLVGTSRGFKTRERVPGSGGFSGVEMVPSPRPNGSEPGPSSLRVNTQLDGSRPNNSNERQLPSFLVSPASPIPKHGRSVILHGHNGGQPLQFGESPLPRLGYGMKKKISFWGDSKGKSRAVDFEEPEVDVDVVEDEDVDMDAVDGSGGPRKSMTSHPRTRKTVARNKAKEKDKARSLSPTSLSTSLHPPDPGTSGHKAEDVLEESMPPKMRKRRIHKEVEALMAKDGSKAKVGNDSKREKQDCEVVNKATSTDKAIDTSASNNRTASGINSSETFKKCSGTTAAVQPGVSPSTPFARLSLLSPAMGATSSSKPALSPPQLTSSTPEASCPRSRPEESPSSVLPVTDSSDTLPLTPKVMAPHPRPITPPPIKTSSSFLARVLNSPQHSWAPFSWGKSPISGESNEDSNQEFQPKQRDDRSGTEATQSQDEDAVTTEPITKEIKQEALEGVEKQSHSTDGEDTVMDGVEQDELLPTPSPPPEPSSTVQGDVEMQVPMDVDSEFHKSTSTVSSEASSRQLSPLPAIILGELQPRSTQRSVSPRVSDLTETTGTSKERPDSPVPTEDTAGFSIEVDVRESSPHVSSPPAHDVATMSSPLSSSIPSPVDPVVMSEVSPSGDVSVQETPAPVPSNTVPELVPSTSISPEHSVGDVLPATPPSVLSSLSPFSSPVSVDSHNDHAKSRPQSPTQNISVAPVTEPTPIVQKPSLHESELETSKVSNVISDDAPMPDQDAKALALSEAPSNSDVEPTQPPEEPQSSSAPSKVKKISLKDFALRKKRMREEEEKERAEKAKTTVEPPTEEAQLPESVDKHAIDVVINGEPSSLEHEKGHAVTDTIKSEIVKSPVPIKTSDPMQQITETKPVEESLVTNPTVPSASIPINGDAQGRPHSPSLAPLPLNITFSSLPTLSIAPAVSKPTLSSPAPDILNPSLSRKVAQQEEGEIEDGPIPPLSTSLLPRAHPSVPPKPPTPVKTKLPDPSLPQNPTVHQLPQNPAKSTPYRPNVLKHGPDSVDARSRTPPTQPRSFTGYGVQYPSRSPHTHTSPIPTTPRVLASVTSPATTTNSASVSATPLSAIGRPPPSGPRALRQQLPVGRVNHSIPRGPSHERDRDSRDWPRYRR